MKKFVCILMALILLAVLAYSLWQIMDIVTEYRGGTDSYAELDQYVAMPEPQVAEPTETEETFTETDEEEVPLVYVESPEVDFEALAQINSDIVGWLYVPDTVINYPIVQGVDNNYYLNHLFNGKTNSSGCIFLDYGAQSDFTSMNSVLHGHHMRNGSMFAGICKYKTQSYYDEHPTAVLVTSDGKYLVRFFAGYVCKDSSDAWNYSFAPEDHQAWLDERMSLSVFETDVVPTTEDRILTLSTCTYEFKDARFVLHGILVPAV